MSNGESVRASGRYVVTDLGREALKNNADCACEIQLVGGLFTCADCGTIWAKVQSIRNILAPTVWNDPKP